MGQYRNCINCRSRYIAQRVTRRFCSDDCRLKWHRAFKNDPTGGKLSLLLRQVADSLDCGQAIRAQVTRLRSMLSSYDRELMAADFVRYSSMKRAKKAVS
jgi:hypothetical protein